MRAAQITTTILAIIVIATFASTANAARDVGWDGGGVGDNWTTAANWADDLGPVTGDSVRIGDSLVSTITVDSDISSGGSVAFEQTRIGRVYDSTLNIASTGTMVTGFLNMLYDESPFPPGRTSSINLAGALTVSTWATLGASQAGDSATLNITGSGTYVNGGLQDIGATGNLGQTTINAGGASFSVNNFTDVKAGGTLSISSGTVSTDRDVRLYDGGTIRVVGSGATSITFADEGWEFFNLNNGGTLDFELGSDGSDPITAITAKILKVDTTQVTTLSVDDSALTGMSIGDKYVLMTYTNVYVNESPAGDEAAALAAGLVYDAGSYGEIIVDADNNQILYEIIPEPATMSLLGLGGLAMLVRRRRRA